jgi:hypothetical protein
MEVAYLDITRLQNASMYAAFIVMADLIYLNAWVAMTPDFMALEKS